MKNSTIKKVKWPFSITILTVLILICAWPFVGFEKPFILLIYLFINLIILILTLSLRVRFFASCHGVDGFLVVIALFLALLIAGLTFLGLLGLLSLQNCFIIFSLIFLALFPFLPVSDGIHTAFLSLRRVFSFNKERLLFSLALIAIILLASHRIYTPPASYDDLMYHLTYPVEWIKSNSISMPPPTPFGYPWLTYFPFNGELLLFWFFLPLQSDFLAKFGQTGFVLFTLAAVFALSQKVGMKRDAVICSCLLALALPKFLLQGIFRSGNDILFAFLFLLSLNFIIALSRRFSVSNVISFSVAFGLLVGTKSLGIMYGLPLFLFFVLMVFYRISKSSLSALSSLFVFLAIVSALGGVSYVRNFLATGNPIFPIRAAIGKTLIFNGPIGKEDIYRSWQTGLNPIEDYPALAFIIATSAFAGFLSLRSPKYRKGVLFVAGPALYVALIYFFGFMRNTRYLYPGMMLSAVSACWVADRIRMKYRGIYLALIRFIIIALFIYILWDFFSGEHFSIGLLFNGFLALCALCISGILAILLPLIVLRYRRSGSRLAAALFATLSIVTFIWLVLTIGKAYDKKKYSRREWLFFTRHGDGKAWKWVEDHSIRGVTIAYAGLDNSYPLYGSELQNKVIYVSRGKKPPRKYGIPVDEENCLVYVSREEGWVAVNDPEMDRKNTEVFGWNYDTWLKNLIDEDVNWLFVRGTYRKAKKHSGKKVIEYPLENEWAASHLQDFGLIYSSDAFKIYVLKGKG